ncbi:thioredoxin family protein [Flavobacterium silvaticum]|uniref:Thioredoxin family protein n=1 Tax=Flavobacterium silvaticum TaxID=1852020 RepID=A0A972FWI6_9FLAO|nr:thioredoxin fold domain-containing protein [Flavobacterium silvaticum]NMH28940.1 thioredoxin family protein [Flavobacterium silvaticum]
MKRTSQILLLFLVFWTFGMTAQEEFKFEEKPLDKVISDAASAGKPAFIMLYASWCPHCHKMKKEVLTDTSVQQQLKSSYVISGFDAEKPDGKAIIKKYKLRSFPTFAFLSTTGELLYAFSGELTVDEFKKELTDAANPKKQLPGLKAAFMADTKNADVCLDYVATLRKAGQPTQEPASFYFLTVPDDKLVSNMNWKIFANGITHLNSREFQDVVKNQSAYAAVSSRKRVDRKLENIMMEALKPGSETGSADLYLPQRKLVSETNLPKGDSLLFVYDRQYFEIRKDWDGYKNATIDKTDKYGAKSTNVLKDVAGIYLQDVTDKAALEKAVTWAQKVEMLQPSKDAYLLTAKLQEKLKDYAAAEASAQKAVDLCNKLGFDSKEATEMLNRLKGNKG